MAKDMNPKYEDDEVPSPAPLSLAWRLDRIEQGDAYMETAYEVMKAIAEEELADDSTEGATLANDLARSAIMAAQACYMAANIRVSEAPKADTTFEPRYPRTGTRD